MSERWVRRTRIFASALAGVALGLTGCTEEVTPRSFPPNEDVSGANFSILQLLQGAKEVPSKADPSGESLFARLLEGLENTGLRATLEGAGPFTLFAPTNTAFESLPTEPDAEGNPQPKIPVTAELLSYHLVNDAVTMAEAGEAGTLATQRAGASLVVQAEVPVGEPADEDAPTQWILNGVVRVASANVPATNGLVHSVDGVLFPNNEFPGTVTEAVRAYQLFGTFTALFESVKIGEAPPKEEKDTRPSLLDLLVQRNTGAGLTLFVPRESAWAGIASDGKVDFTSPGEPDLTPAEYDARLTELLLSHVVPGTVANPDAPLTTASTTFPTLNVRQDAEGNIFLNEDADPETPDAQVTWTALKCTDGVIHVINTVLNRPVLAEEAP